MLLDIGWTLTRTVAPGIPAVGLEELKDHLRVTHDEEDSEIATYGLAAEEAVEAELSRALITQTWVLKLDRFPCWEIKMPRPPLQSVTSVQYLDSAGATQTLATSVYTVDTTSTPGRIHLAYEQEWPTTQDVPNAVIVTYKAGGTTAADVPHPTRQMVKLLVGEMYENRETGAADVIALWREIPTYARLMANQRCVHEFHYT